jgi:predicted ribosome quality control (RQC) complex YloA/Tae2 family protein
MWAVAPKKKKENKYQNRHWTTNTKGIKKILGSRRNKKRDQLLGNYAQFCIGQDYGQIN